MLIGRVLFVVIFLGSAYQHLTMTDGMAEFAKSKGVPQPWLAVFGSGIVQGLGGLSVLLGIWADLGALLLFLFTLSTALIMHSFWKLEGEARNMDQIQFVKDLALAGASLMLVGLFSIAGHRLGFTITGPLF